MEKIMDCNSFLSRRTFLAGGALASAGMSSFTHSTVSAEETPAGKTPRKIIGCYASIDDVLNNPRFIDALQKKLGVNTLICGSAITLPQWLREMNPVNAKRAHLDDDSNLRKAIEEVHRRGMDFWLWVFADHHYYGDEGRHLMSETVDGINFLDLPPIRYSLEFRDEAAVCVAKPGMRDYDTAFFGHAAKMYDADTVYVSHQRYANPSRWSNLLGCGCSSCRMEAENMGYDFDVMKDSMIRLHRNLRKLDPKTLEQAVRSGLTLTDFLVLIGEDNGVMDWLVFRAKVRSNQLKRVNNAVHLMSGNRRRFVLDTHPATLSLLVGHNWEDFIDGASDAIFPLSWLGWHYISPVAAWSNQLCEWIPGLEESTAIKLVLGLFGWDGLGIPDTKIADLMIGDNGAVHKTSGPVYQAFFNRYNPEITLNLITHEWTKMAAINRRRLPAHPVIKAKEWPENVCRELIGRADDLGLSGYVFQGTDSLIDRNRL